MICKQDKLNFGFCQAALKNKAKIILPILFGHFCEKHENFLLFSTIHNVVKNNGDFFKIFFIIFNILKIKEKNRFYNKYKRTKKEQLIKC